MKHSNNNTWNFYHLAAIIQFLGLFVCLCVIICMSMSITVSSYQNISYNTHSTSLEANTTDCLLHENNLYVSKTLLSCLYYHLAVVEWIEVGTSMPYQPLYCIQYKHPTKSTYIWPNMLLCTRYNNCKVKLFKHIYQCFLYFKEIFLIKL